jgi:hypothetical protein
MVKDVIALAPAWGYLQTDIRLLDDKDFTTSGDSSAGRDKLTKDFDGIFASVKAADYKQALALLPAMSGDVDKLVTGKAAETVKGAIAQATKMAEHGAAWSTGATGREGN